MYSRARAALGPSLVFGALMAGGAFWRASVQHAPATTALAATAETFLIFGLLAFGLQSVGLAWRDPESGELFVSKWLGWAVAGALVTFLTVLVVVNRSAAELRLRPAIIASGIWILLLGAAWALWRVSRHGERLT